MMTVVIMMIMVIMMFMFLEEVWSHDGRRLWRTVTIGDRKRIWRRLWRWRRRRQMRRYYRRRRRQSRDRSDGGGRCDSDGFYQTLERDRRAPVLKALVRGQAVFGPIPSPAEFAYVQRVEPSMFVLKVPFQRVVAAERPPAVRTVLWLVDTAVGWRW